MNTRLRLLFLAHPFPPAEAIGCIRTWNMAKYLARLGWEVTVVTPEPTLLGRPKISDEFSATMQHEGIRQILTGQRWCFLYTDGGLTGCSRLAAKLCRKIATTFEIDSRIGWVSAVEKACGHLASEDVDVILATGSPFISFEIAGRLSERLGRPFVLDYRDPWSRNPHARRPRSARLVEKEHRLLQSCDAVTIVSDSLATLLQEQFCLERHPDVITNGYDPGELLTIPAQQFDEPAIVYTGTFYPPLRVITPVMQALRFLSQADEGSGMKRPWRFHYYGLDNEHVREAAERAGIVDRVELHGKVPRRTALGAVKGAAASVVVTSVSETSDRAVTGIVTGKIFDALGFGTPILLVSPRGSDADAILQQSGGGRCFSGGDVAGMAAYLGQIVAGEVSRGHPPRAYAWPELVQKLDAVLRRAATNRRVSTPQLP